MGLWGSEVRILSPRPIQFLICLTRLHSRECLVVLLRAALCVGRASESRMFKSGSARLVVFTRSLQITLIRSSQTLKTIDLLLIRGTKVQYKLLYDAPNRQLKYDLLESGNCASWPTVYCFCFSTDERLAWTFISSTTRQTGSHWR